MVLTTLARRVFGPATARLRPPSSPHHARTSRASIVPGIRASSASAMPHENVCDATAACVRCRGEGALFALSKAQRKKRKANREDGASSPREVPAKRIDCVDCGGSGVTRARTPTRAASKAEVAIVGGGVGGVALALALRHRGVAVTVYERDESFESRKQGYGLTMQKYSGGAALRSLGLQLRGVGSDAHVSMASDGRVLGLYGHSAREGVTTKEDLGDENGSVSEAMSDEKRNVHLPRQKLRRTLLEALEPECVAWGKRFDAYEEVEDGVVLRFDDGTSAKAGILVGADGIFSRVRAQKLGDEPLSYLGVLVVLGICRGVDHPLCRNKVFQVVDGENRMYAMPFTASADGDGCIPPLDDGEGDATTTTSEETQPGAMMWQLSFPVSEDEAKAIAADPARLRQEAMRRCGSWPEPVGTLLEHTREDCMAGYPAFDRDMTPAKVLRGDTSSRVTLIGDAAHPMSPFKGQGANQALLDAVHLARCVVRSPEYLLPGERRYGCVHPFATVQDALAEAEKSMLQRSKGKVTKSRDAAKYLHSPAALAEGNCVRAHAAASALAGDDDE